MSKINERYGELPPVNRKIHSFIVDNNYTVRKFAIEIGVAQQSVQRLFSIDKDSGKYPLPSTYIRNAMINRFNLSYDWFIVNDVTFDDSSAPKGEDNASRTARLGLVKEYLKLTGQIRSVNDIARKMMKSEQNINMIFCGKIHVSDRFLYMLNDTFDNIFNITWLINGDGSMLSESKNEQADESVALISEIERLKALLNDASAEIIRLNKELRELRGNGN